MPEEFLDPDKAAEPDKVLTCGDVLSAKEIWLRERLRLERTLYCPNEMELAHSSTCAPEGHRYCPDHTSELVQTLQCCSEECAIKEAERLQQRTPQEPSRSKGLPVWQK